MSLAKETLDLLLAGQISQEEALTRLTQVETMGFARLDLGRKARTGHSEVIFGQGKEATQVLTLCQKLLDRGQSVLVTRLEASKAQEIQRHLPQLQYQPLSRLLWYRQPGEPRLSGSLALLSAGTSDQAVALEAQGTAEFLGAKVQAFQDVGVAGLHRLMNELDQIRQAKAIVVVAGMDGVLPSLVGGLVDKPVIAVPTSVGYGAAFGGLAPLLTMLNSCAAGVTVVNIDNGFGAAFAACQILRANSTPD